ncbi:MAG: S8 family serine peptidase [Pirellulales bacterium]
MLSKWRKRAEGRTSRRIERFRGLQFENLEDRLALTWVGVPPTSISPPASAVSVTLNSSGDATGAATIATTEVDYYSFTALSSGSYAISATTPSSSVDTVLGVFSASGVRLAYNDDVSYPTNTDSRVTLNLVAGTRYYVGITNYAATSRGSYTWTIDGPTPAASDDSYENNDTLATAYNLGTLTASRTIGQLKLADAQDYFRFTTTSTGTAASSVSISFQNAQGNLQLALYNSSGTLLATSQTTGNSETISLNGRVAGTYYVRVYGANGATNPNYSLTIAPPASTTAAPVTALPDVAYYGGSNEWNLNSINAPEAWAAGYTGEGVVVAVVDTGVDWDHAELVHQIWVNADEIAGNGVDDDGNGYVDDVRGWDFASSDNNPDDQNGHGTHVAGIIAADDNGSGSTGVAPDATIMPVRVLGSDGSGTESAVAAGIRYAAQNGADIINLSLGGSYSSVIYAAIQFAQSLNVLVVAAAGNESAATPSNPARASATLNNVISVGAYNSSGTIASFSNDVGTSGAIQVDAPGVNVYSSYFSGRYATFSGTSMAAPHVAGLAALALSANNALTASQLRSVIVSGANHTIAGSDSRGGINAAVTVALALAGQTSGNLSASTTAATSNGSTLARVAARSLEQAYLEQGIDGTLAAGTRSQRSSSVPVSAFAATSADEGRLTAALVDLVMERNTASERDGNATTTLTAGRSMEVGVPGATAWHELDFAADSLNRHALA